MNIAKRVKMIGILPFLYMLLFMHTVTWAISAEEFKSRVYTFQTAYPTGYCNNNETWTINGGNVGWQCFGFANEMAYHVWGTYPTTSSSADYLNWGWTITRATVDNPQVEAVQVGDVVRFRSSTENDHSIFITGVTADAVIYSDCNAAGDDVVCHGRVMSKSTLAAKMVQPLANNPALCGWIAHNTYENHLTDRESPIISNVSITELDATGYTVTCTVSDNVGVTRVAFPTFPDADNQWNPVWLDGTISGDTATFRVSISDHGELVNTSYETHIYAYDAEGNHAVYGCESQIIDAEAPVITDVRITEKNKDGYTVTCVVRDNIGVVKVAFPTFPDENNEWNAIWMDGELSGETASFRVNTADHAGFVNTEYQTHIYVYDAAGNYSIYGCDSLVLDTVSPAISQAGVIDIDRDGYTVTAEIVDNIGVENVRVCTWISVGGSLECVENDAELTDNMLVWRVNEDAFGKKHDNWYQTDIFVRDAYGNETKYTGASVSLKKSPWIVFFCLGMIAALAGGAAIIIYRRQVKKRR